MSATDQPRALTDAEIIKNLAAMLRQLRRWAPELWVKRTTEMLTRYGLQGSVFRAANAELPAETPAEDLRKSIEKELSRLPQYVADSLSNNGEPMVKLSAVKKAVRAAIAEATAETGDVDWSIAERGVVA